MQSRIIPPRPSASAETKGVDTQSANQHGVPTALLSDRGATLFPPELLDAEVERRRKAEMSRDPVANVVSVAGTTLANAAYWAGFEARSQARIAKALARFAPAMDAEPMRKCDHHPGTILALDRERTLDRSQKEDGYQPVFAVCGACDRDDREDRRWRHAGVPERVLRATLTNYQTPDKETEDALAKARKFAATARARGGFFLLLGTTGTGKGHLATGAAKEICPRGDVIFLGHADLLTKLRSSYSTGDTERFIERLKSVSALILDEYGVSVGGKDEMPVLHQILSTRHDRRKPTIFTSNEELDRVRELLGFRLLDRIREDFILANLTGPSWRVRGPLS